MLDEFGGAQFSTFKKALAELTVSRLAPVNAEMNRLLADPAEIDRVLAEGAAQGPRPRRPHRPARQGHRRLPALVTLRGSHNSIAHIRSA